MEKVLFDRLRSLPPWKKLYTIVLGSFHRGKTFIRSNKVFSKPENSINDRIKFFPRWKIFYSAIQVPCAEELTNNNTFLRGKRSFTSYATQDVVFIVKVRWGGLLTFGAKFEGFRTHLSD